MTATLGVGTLPVNFVIATVGTVLNLGVDNTTCTIGGTGRFRQSGSCDAVRPMPGTGSNEAVINGVVNCAEVFQKMP